MKNLRNLLILLVVSCLFLSACGTGNAPTEPQGTTVPATEQLELVDYARKCMPDLTITSDIIVGFPGETEEEFEETISLIQQVHYDSLFTFIFSPRTGTPAAKMEDPTPKEEKNRRFDRLCAVQNGISVEIHNGYIGKTMNCLVDGRDGDQLTARTEGGRLVRFQGEDSLIGTYQNIAITGATTWSLTGQMQNAECRMQN